MDGDTADHRRDKQEWINKTQSKDADRDPNRQQKCEIGRPSSRRTTAGKETFCERRRCLAAHKVIGGSTPGSEKKSRAENGGATDRVKTHSVLISCAIDQRREHRDLLLVCRTARALRG